MSFIGILILQFFALIIPGPDFLLVSRTGITDSKVAVCQVVAGICTGALIWMILSILGLHILFQTYPVVNQLVMLGGACYLMVLAYGIAVQSNQEVAEVKKIQGQFYFLKGLMCNLSNPKAIIYFASIFSALPLGSDITNILIIITLLLIESFVCFVGLGILFSHSTIKRTYYQYTKKIDIVSSFIFVFFALLLLIKFFVSLDL
ncbi:LysE family transporter [Commensalibacter nepenthis]|uniref:LysE family transporter n=1 Tax=Commensalibacter nepenthis TaxID=3043872 RepID=A0ABT6QAE5_9PROT|nr:LysE family transporter [Commensalibacter sp. TBRC 10068]MDI2113280.1 LysE family transporter [Commensalibacter sp. TBRC 10068]